MKQFFKALIILIFLSQLLSCGENALERNQRERTIQANKNEAIHGTFIPNPFIYNNGEYGVEIIDGCEYIMGWSGSGNGGPTGMHKGNCKFCQTRLDTMFAQLYRKLRKK